MLVSVTVLEARKFPDIKFVSFDWLTASIDSQARADEAQFSFSQLNSSHAVATDSMGSAPSKQIDTKGKGKKRLRSPVPMEEDSLDANELAERSPMKKHKEVQRAKSGSLLIPVDETCPLTGKISDVELFNSKSKQPTNTGTHRVYIGVDGMIYDAALNQTSAGANNNKFYRVQILVSGAGDYQTWTRWGRVGELGTGTTLGDGSLASAMSAFEKKFKDKAGVPWSNRFDAPTRSRQKGYYTFVERKYEDDSDDDAEELSAASASGPSKNRVAASPVKRADSALPKSVQRLMELIFNQQYFADTMRELDYDADKLPLGKLSKRTLERGFEILKDLSELLTDPAIADNKHNMPYLDAIAACSDAFYTVIPHAFGRNRPPVISSDEKLKKEINLMESLSDMQIASTIMKDTGGDAAVNELDRQFSGLGLQEMIPRKS